MAKYKNASNQELIEELHRTEMMQDNARVYYDDMYEELLGAQDDISRVKERGKGISGQMLSTMERCRVLNER